MKYKITNIKHFNLPFVSCALGSARNMSTGAVSLTLKKEVIISSKLLVGELV